MNILKTVKEYTKGVNENGPRNWINSLRGFLQGKKLHLFTILYNMRLWLHIWIKFLVWENFILGGVRKLEITILQQF